MSEFTNEGFNAGYRAGILSERERIVALLKTLQTWESPIPVSESHIDRIIALINGENE